MSSKSLKNLILIKNKGEEEKSDLSMNDDVVGQEGEYDDENHDSTVDEDDGDLDDYEDNSTLNDQNVDTAIDDEKEAESVLQSTSHISTSTASSSTKLISVDYHRIPVPSHRYTPLRTHWLELYEPIVEHMKLQIRFNPSKRLIELRTSNATVNPNSIQKSADFIRAFILGFDIKDAIALLRLDDLFIDSFEVKDVRSLSGEHLSRAIGRIAGVGGKTKYTIENATRTRIVVADSQIHLLGAYLNINLAKTAIVKLIRGAPPGKIYTQMKAVASRAKQTF